MNADLKLAPPTDKAKESFYNYVRYEVNAARQAAGLPMLDSEQSAAYLVAALEFFNKHGVLKSGSGT
jgi:hypothetical protein